MSKKSRRRNRRLAKAAGLIGALALLGRRRGTAQGVGGADKAAFTSDAAYKIPSKVVVPPKKNYITKKSDVDNTITRTSGITLSPSGQKIGAGGVGADGLTRGQRVKRARLSRMNAVPPSMRGGAETAQGFVRKVPIGRGRGPNSVEYGWTTEPYKKGGRVKLAKRGLGRAFTKAKK